MNDHRNSNKPRKVGSQPSGYVTCRRRPRATPVPVGTLGLGDLPIVIGFAFCNCRLYQILGILQKVYFGFFLVEFWLVINCLFRICPALSEHVGHVVSTHWGILVIVYDLC